MKTEKGKWEHLKQKKIQSFDKLFDANSYFNKQYNKVPSNSIKYVHAQYYNVK